MQFFRFDRIAAVWRQTPKETRNKTIFGETIVKVKRCNSCKNYLPVVDFYMESKSKSKFPDQTRNICISCYDIANGKYLNRNTEECSDHSLEEFLSESD
jgi:hypothetical protein